MSENLGVGLYKFQIYKLYLENNLNENNICFKSYLIDEKLYDLFTKL